MVPATSAKSGFFISYVREEATAFSDQLAQAIDDAGYQAWLDRKAIEIGEVWHRELDAAIAGCDAFIAVITAGYIRSTVCDLELTRAIDKRKLILPVLLDKQAEKPFFIQNHQHIDCTGGLAVKDCVLALVARLGHGVVASQPRPATAQHTPSNATRFVSQRQGTPQRPGVYLPDLYSGRTTIEKQLESFLEGDASIALLLGDSGAGKTNLLCSWVSSVEKRGHGVLVYDCAELQDLEREICLDLQSPPGLPFAQAVEAAASHSAAAGQRLVLAFDAINEYDDRDHNGIVELLKSLNAMAGRIVAPNLKIVLTCNAVTWLRQDRTLASLLDSRKVFTPSDGSTYLTLGTFSDEEFGQAYPRYEKYFDLKTPLDALPAAVRKRLCEPELLRLAAEEHRGKELEVSAGGLHLGVYWKYFERRVQTRAERNFISRLSSEMLRRQTSSIPLADLPTNEPWANVVWEEDPDSPYNRLLDGGVLKETRAGLNTILRFGRPQFASYAFAQILLATEDAPDKIVATLIPLINSFPLAWDAAKTLLVLKLVEPGNGQKQPDWIATLADSNNLDTRSLMAEALIEAHCQQPKQAEPYIRNLLDSNSDRARRTAIKAAYRIGPATRPILLAAAASREAGLQILVKDTLYLIWRSESPVDRLRTTQSLYLIWRQAPGFTYGFLTDLINRITLTNIQEIKPILEFVLDLSITIYVNHCEVPEVRDHTAALYKDLAVAHLHLPLLNIGILGPAFEFLVSGAVGRIVSSQVLEWAGLTESFFSMPAPDRSCLIRIAGMLDPDADLTTAAADLQSMLESGVPIFCGAATLATVVHACHHFDVVEPLIRNLFDKIDDAAKMWLLAGFSVLLPDTPPAWVPFLEAVTTRSLAMGGPRLIASAPKQGFDAALALLPLGLAYGKADHAMEFFTSAIDKATADGDAVLTALLFRSLGLIGYFYPRSAFSVLRNHVPAVGDAAIQDAAVTALATIRTLHFDSVDEFLGEIDAPEWFRRNVEASTSVDQIGPLIRVLGYFNNAVHLSLNYPRMRRQLAGDLLRLLATAGSFNEAAEFYTKTLMRMFRESDFDLLRWTDAE